MTTILTILTLLSTIVAASYLAALLYIKWFFGYFKRRNIPYLEPKSVFGSLEAPWNRKTAMCNKIRQFYDEMKARQLKYCGVYFSLGSFLFINDPDLLKLILSKDFSYFIDRGFYYNEKDDPISAHLFALGGVKWRNLHAKLKPAFTPGKLKLMFNTLTDSGSMLKSCMDDKYAKHEPVDIKHVSQCFTLNNIGSCAFGLECNSFKDQNSTFQIFGNKALADITKSYIKELLTNNFPGFAKMIRLKTTNNDVSDFFMKVVKETVNYRETNKIERKDFLQLLIEIKNDDASSSDSQTLTINEVVAQCFIFFVAGFETSANLMTFALYELAKHQDIQDKVRQEIVDVLKKYDGQITYDSINDLKYMKQVMYETLRKYPPAELVTRQCVSDYQIPEHKLTIKQGEKIAVPIIGIHYDPQYYPEPEIFDPDRFSDVNKQSRLPYTFLPFGEGQRICIGRLFGLMQSKVGLTTLLKHFKFSLNAKTKQPLTMDPNAFICTAEGGIWLDMNKI